jgi:FkbM family methyltransferase
MQTTINGRTFQVEEEPRDYWGWVSAGNYDREWQVYDRYLSREQTFIDVGAWVGAHSLYAKHLAGYVVSIEPDPIACEILCRNVPGDVRRLAISDTIGTIRLGSQLLGASTTRACSRCVNNFGGWADGEQFDVDCITLRQLVKGLNNSLFIKLDVEGAEEKIFRDVEFFAERKPTLFVELHPWWWDDEAEGWKAFETVKGLYTHQEQVFHNTWVLRD